MSRRALAGRRQMMPRALRNSSERREYLVAFGMVAVLQGAIAVSLGVCALQTYRMWQHDVPYVPGEIGRVVPVLLGVGAVIALAGTLRSLGRIRALRRIPLDSGDAG